MLKNNITIEDKPLLLLFIISFFNKWLILLMLVYLCYKALNDIKYSIEGLLLISFRTIIGLNIAVDIGGIQLFKWIAIFALSTLIFINSKNKCQDYSLRLLILLFSLYIFAISIINSTYPLVSIFKCLSYIYVFTAVLQGVIETKDKINWFEKLYLYMTIIFISSFFSIPFSFAYYSSAHWFAGVTNQSNMFGILAGLYIGIILTKVLNKQSNIFDLFMFVITIVMEWMSNSRTGMLSILISIIIYLFICIFKKQKFHYLVIGFLVLCLILTSNIGEILLEKIYTFIFKSDSIYEIQSLNASDVFSSRAGQLSNFIEKFNNNWLIGSGFCVPFIKNYTSWQFSFNLIVEPGNIVYAVLGDLGLIGFLLWIFLYGYIFLKSYKFENICLFIAPFTICLGEMVFFSTNNIAIILYVMIAIYYTRNNNYLHEKRL